MADETSLVRGSVVFEPTMPAFADATVYIRLEDVSVADAAAQAVAEQTLPHVSHANGGSEKIAFVLHCPVVNPRNTYNVRVHISQSGAQGFQMGDYISIQSYSVLTNGNGNTVEVRVRPV